MDIMSWLQPSTHRVSILGFLKAESPGERWVQLSVENHANIYEQPIEVEQACKILVSAVVKLAMLQ